MICFSFITGVVYASNQQSERSPPSPPPPAPPHTNVHTHTNLITITMVHHTGMFTNKIRNNIRLGLLLHIHTHSPKLHAQSVYIHKLKTGHMQHFVRDSRLTRKFKWIIHTKLQVSHCKPQHIILYIYRYHKNNAMGHAWLALASCTRHWFSVHAPPVI